MDDKKTLKRQLDERLRQLPEGQLRKVLNYVESLRHDSSSPASSIEEKIAQIVGEAPKAAWKNVPADGAEHHDHHIYGQPRTDK